MSEAKPVDDRQQMADASKGAKDNMTPENYFSTLSVRQGMIAGVIGSFGIIAVITVLALLSGLDPMLSPRFIASVILRDAAWATSAAGSTFAIAIGTLMHVAAGAFYGAIFAYLMPKMPRGFWFVTGLIFGVVIWGIAAFALPILTPDNQIDSLIYTNAQIISHLIFGITLGVAGSFFGKVEST
ncbi:MAG: DUF6789 family protein [Anaerolineae bacterium]